MMSAVPAPMRRTSAGHPFPLIAWPEFRRSLRWRQGEHVSLVGPTDTGKTTIALDLVGLRDFVVFLATKPRDPLLTSLSRRGWHRTDSVPHHSVAHRVLVWPRFTGDRDLPHQRAVMGRALAHCFAVGGWAVFVDEGAYLCDDLGLTRPLKTMWRQGRSNDCSLVFATQRPAHVPLDAYSQASHLFLFGTNDDRDLRRIGGLNGNDARVVREAVAALDRGSHDFVYVNTRTGECVRSRFVKHQTEDRSA